MRDHSIPSRAQGASSSPSDGGAPSQRFEFALAIAAEQRHRRIRSELEPSISGIGEGEGEDGFLPAEQAAAAMGVSESELAQLAARGLLEYRDFGAGLVWVRPAIVSVAAVTDERP